MHWGGYYLLSLRTGVAASAIAFDVWFVGLGVYALLGKSYHAFADLITSQSSLLLTVLVVSASHIFHLRMTRRGLEFEEDYVNDRHLVVSAWCCVLGFVLCLSDPTT